MNKISDVIMGFAGAYNSINEHLQLRKNEGISDLKTSVIWMFDEEGAHVIDTDKLVEAMDAFLTVLEENDVVMEVKRTVTVEVPNEEKSEANSGEHPTNQTENS